MSLTRSRNTEPATGLKPRPVALRPLTIEKVFTDCVMDLKEIVVLDGIDILPDGFRVRGHDLHGPLPEIVIKNSSDTFVDKDRLGIAACRLISIVGLREEMIRCVPGGRFLPADHNGRQGDSRNDQRACDVGGRGEGFPGGMPRTA